MPFNTERRLFHGRPRPSFRRFGVGIQRIENFPLVIAQISRNMSHRSLMRQPAPTPTFDRKAAAITFRAAHDSSNRYGSPEFSGGALGRCCVANASEL